MYLNIVESTRLRWLIMIDVCPLNNNLAHLQGMYTLIFQTLPYITKYLDIKTFTKKKHARF